MNVNRALSFVCWRWWLDGWTAIDMQREIEDDDGSLVVVLVLGWQWRAGCCDTTTGTPCRSMYIRAAPFDWGCTLRQFTRSWIVGGRGGGDEANSKLRFDLIRVRLNEQKEHQELSSGWLHIVHYYSGAQHSVGMGRESSRYLSPPLADNWMRIWLGIVCI